MGSSLNYAGERQASACRFNALRTTSGAPRPPLANRAIRCHMAHLSRFQELTEDWRAFMNNLRLAHDRRKRAGGG